MDKGDLGTLVGAIAGGTLVAATGVGIPWIIAGSTIGAYGGHNLASHYKPLYQH